MLGRSSSTARSTRFYARLAAYEPRFIQREAELDNAGLRQRFVASLRRDPAARLGYKAEIKMRLVGMDTKKHKQNEREEGKRGLPLSANEGRGRRRGRCWERQH